MAKVLLLVEPAFVPDTGLQAALDARLAGRDVRFAPDADGARNAVRSLADPTVLVAIVSGAATVLTAIIGAVSTLVANAKKDKPGTPAGVIRLKVGKTELEFPADTPDERVKELVEQARLLDTQDVRIALVSR